jgi:TATA-box binding protein (TBP) (component of TFIID and TFIIIB)
MDNIKSWSISMINVTVELNRPIDLNVLHSYLHKLDVPHKYQVPHYSGITLKLRDVVNNKEWMSNTTLNIAPKGKINVVGIKYEDMIKRTIEELDGWVSDCPPEVFVK